MSRRACARTGDRQRAAPSTVSNVHVASASASPSARPFHLWPHISPRYAWATPSVASRVRSCRTDRGGRPTGFALFSPRRQAAWLPEASRAKASPGILTRSLRCASGCGFRPRPRQLFPPNDLSNSAVARMTGQWVGAARSPQGEITAP